MFVSVWLSILEDDQREKSLSHHTIQQLILEKDQALADLNSVEKSLADLFRRYEKMKDVLEGFRKVVKTSLHIHANTVSQIGIFRYITKPMWQISC